MESFLQYSTMTKYVGVTEAAEYLWEQIDDWRKNAIDELDEACNTSIKEAKNEIKKLSKGTTKRRVGGKKHYTSCFTTKKPKDLCRQLWNKKYQLSHLLEDGHAVYNQFGGPYKVKHRTAGAGSKHPDVMKTSNYDMWKDTYDYLEDFFINEVKNKL